MLFKEDPPEHMLLCSLRRLGCFAPPKPISSVVGSGNDSGIILKMLFKVQEGWRFVGKGRALPQQLRGWVWAGTGAGQGRSSAESPAQLVASV